MTVKFRFSDYLSRLSEKERQIIVPYLMGTLLIGLFIPACIWLISTVGNQIINKVYPQTDISTYSHIGWCYVNQECRQTVLNRSTGTNEKALVLVPQIKSYMLDYMRAKNKDRVAK